MPILAGKGIPSNVYGMRQSLKQTLSAKSVFDCFTFYSYYLRFAMSGCEDDSVEQDGFSAIYIAITDAITLCLDCNEPWKEIRLNRRPSNDSVAVVIFSVYTCH